MVFKSDKARRGFFARLRGAEQRGVERVQQFRESRRESRREREVRELQDSRRRRLLTEATAQREEALLRERQETKAARIRLTDARAEQFELTRTGGVLRGVRTGTRAVGRGIVSATRSTRRGVRRRGTRRRTAMETMFGEQPRQRRQPARRKRSPRGGEQTFGDFLDNGV